MHPHALTATHQTAHLQFVSGGYRGPSWYSRGPMEEAVYICSWRQTSRGFTFWVTSRQNWLVLPVHRLSESVAWSPGGGVARRVPIGDGVTGLMDWRSIRSLRMPISRQRCSAGSRSVNHRRSPCCDCRPVEGRLRLPQWLANGVNHGEIELRLKKASEKEKAGRLE
jgi:hypothetical protein